jgi:hypothetical protein
MILTAAKEILVVFSKIEYGFLDTVNKLRRITDDDFWDNFMKDYVLQTPEQVLQNQTGVCWDQVELARKLFAEKNISVKTYFICYYDGKLPAHTILTFEDGDKVYWFESSWPGYIGISPYNSLKELLQNLKQKFIASDFNGIPPDYDHQKLRLHEYKQPEYGIGVDEFFCHVEKSV